MASTEVGVPVISPVAALSNNPDGSDGDTVKFVTAPPETVGCSGEIACPTVNTFGVRYDNPVGALSLIVIVIVKELSPLSLDAVTVYPVVAVMAAGVPEITPESKSIERPSGSAGETVKVHPLPENTGVSGEIGTPTVNRFGELYVSPFGATGLTAIEIVNDVLPPVFVAVTR